MASPLLRYVNGYLLIAASGSPQVVSGRFVAVPGRRYVVRCYLTRQDSTGVTTGADYLPSQGSPGDLLPGASGNVYLYRGYALSYAEVSNVFDLGVTAVPTSGWVELVSNAVPEWLVLGATGQHRQGNEKVKHMKIEGVTGKFGGAGIDYQVSVKIGGVPITVRSGEVVD